MNGRISADLLVIASVINNGVNILTNMKLWLKKNASGIDKWFR